VNLPEMPDAGGLRAEKNGGPTAGDRVAGAFSAGVFAIRRMPESFSY